MTEKRYSEHAPADFTDPGLILIDLDAHTSESAIRKLGALLLSHGYVKPTFIDAVLERERNSPTGLPLAGDVSVAIPHADVEHVVQPALAIATLRSPVPFGNMGEPTTQIMVSMVILMALDDAQAQVEMLRQLALLLQDPHRVTRLYESPTPEDLLTGLRGESNHIS